LNKPTEAPLKRETTPIEARGGAVSGRVVMILVSSCVGAIIAVGLCWAFLLPH
jgi:hypothetical protein